MSGDEPDPLSVFVYFDYTCPFSYVARARLALLERELPMRIGWRPFQIHPAVPPSGRPVRELGVPPDEWSAMERAVEEMARDLDLPFDLPDFVPDSSEALQASEFARDLSRASFDRLHEEVFRAYFGDGRDIGRRDVLLEIARTAGVDAEALERALEDERYESELRRAREEAERYGVTGTPTHLFGRYKVVGAAPLVTLRDAAQKAMEDRSEPDGTERGRRT